MCAFVTASTKLGSQLFRRVVQAEYVEKLESVFQQIDDSGQGMITEARLNEILQDPKVAVYFQTLDLDVHEGRDSSKFHSAQASVSNAHSSKPESELDLACMAGTALFHILDNGDAGRS